MSEHHSRFGGSSVLAREIALRAELYGTGDGDKPWGVNFRTSLGTIIRAQGASATEAREDLAARLDAWANNFGSAL